MANEIGWGNAFDAVSGWGMASINNGDNGYGNVVINSYSGESNISSADADNEINLVTESEDFISTESDLLLVI